VYAGHGAVALDAVFAGFWKLIVGMQVWLVHWVTSGCVQTTGPESWAINNP
jgi:hypothetical protein